LCSEAFKRVVESGRRRASGGFVVITAPQNEARGLVSDENRSRLGVTVSKRVGNAVVRNRIKRKLREFFRRQRQHFQINQDTLIIARRGAGALAHEDFHMELHRVIGRRPGR